VVILSLSASSYRLPGEQVNLACAFVVGWELRATSSRQLKTSTELVFFTCPLHPRRATSQTWKTTTTRLEACFTCMILRERKRERGGKKRMRQWLSAARMRRFAVGSVLRCVSSVYTCASLLPHSSGSGSVPTNVHADRVVRNDEKKKYQFGSPGNGIC
jgi:hypothetical protein